MSVEKIIRDIALFLPWNEQEEMDRTELLRLLRNHENILTRENCNAHLTASAWVTDPTRSKVLMVYHNLYNSWSWPGGHADGQSDMAAVALREVNEECGVRARLALPDIFSLEILTVDGHEKKGKYVSSHLHLNVTYLLEADPAEPLHGKADENSGVAWFALDDAIAASTEPWFQARIYSKLNAKLRALKS